MDGILWFTHITINIIFKETACAKTFKVEQIEINGRIVVLIKERWVFLLNTSAK
jgi:hypothetical protein